MEKRIKTQYFNNTLIVSVNGNVFTNSTMSDEESMEVLMRIINEEHTDEFIDEIKDIMGFDEMFRNDVQKSREENESLVKSAIGLDDFYYEKDSGKVFYRDYKVTVPKVLFERITEAFEAGDMVEYELLVNFWKNALLNPNPTARVDLFSFLEKYNFKITPSGHFIAFRRLDKFYDESVEFVNDVYQKMKRWKKSPKNAIIVELKYSDGWVSYTFYDSKKKSLSKHLAMIEENGGAYTDYRVLGNAFDLYDGGSTIYTDNHTKTFRIKLGEEVTQERVLCDSDPNSSCSRGLHLGTPNFVTNNSYFGSVIVSALIHPKDVVAVPNHDTNKLRCCRYLPIEVIDSATDYVISDEDLMIYDSLVSEYISNELSEYLRNTEILDIPENSTLPSDLTMTNFDDLEKEIANRVVDIN